MKTSRLLSFQTPKTVCAALGQRLHRTKKGLRDLYKCNLPNNDANHTAEEMFMSENYDQQQPPLLSRQHRTKFQESVNGNVAETCETVAETRRITCVSVSGFVTFTHVSVAAYTAEPDHFLYTFPSSFS